MPVDGFSVGRDYTLTIVTSRGTLDLPGLTNFSKRPEWTDVKVKLITGRTRHARFPDGWTGTFDVERMDSTVDDYFAQLEADYYVGVNEKPGTITETISEVDGSVSQYRYTGVLLKLDDAGAAAGDQTVKQRLSFVAETRVKVS